MSTQPWLTKARLFSFEPTAVRKILPTDPFSEQLSPHRPRPIGVAVIFGVDELMDMGRTCVNLIGNCLATVVVARWEGEFDDRRAAVFGTPKEIALDLESGDVAFAEAVRQG